LSGGYFDYKNYLLRDWHHQLEHLIKSNNEENEYGYKRGYKEETLRVFKIASSYANMLDTMLHEIDYLVSSDIGEDDMLKAIAGKFHKIWKDNGHFITNILGEELGIIISEKTGVTPEPKQMEMFDVE